MFRTRAFALVAAITALLALLPFAAPAAARDWEMHAETTYYFIDSNGVVTAVEVLVNETRISGDVNATLYYEISRYDEQTGTRFTSYVNQEQPIPASAFTFGAGSARVRVSVPGYDTVTGTPATLTFDLRWRCTDPTHDSTTYPPPYFDCNQDQMTFGSISDGTFDFGPRGSTWGSMWRRAPYA